MTATTECVMAEKTAMNLIKLGAFYDMYGNGHCEEGDVDKAFEQLVFVEAARRCGIPKHVDCGRVDYAEFSESKRTIIAPYVQAQIREHVG